MNNVITLFCIRLLCGLSDYGQAQASSTKERDSGDLIFEDWMQEVENTLSKHPAFADLKKAFAFYQAEQKDSSVAALVRAHDMFKPNKYTNAFIDLKRLIGQIYAIDLHAYEVAQPYLAAVEQNISKKERARAYFANLYWLIETHYWAYESEKVIAYALEGRTLAKEKANIYYEALFVQWLGKGFALQEAYEKVSDYYQSMLVLAKAMDNEDFVYAANFNLACNYYKMNQSQKSLSYLEDCQSYFEAPSRDEKTLANFMIWEGIIKGANEQYEAAYAILKEVITLYDSLNIVKRRIHARLELAKLYQRQNKHVLCIRQATEVLNTFQYQITPLDKRFAYGLLYWSHKDLAQYKLALQYNELFTKAKAEQDSINNAHFVKEIEERYKTAEQQQIIAQKEADQFWLLLALGLVLAFLVGAFFSIFSLDRIRKQLVQKNQVIESQTQALKSLDQAKSRFFANISHELRTPLTLMLSPIQNLLKGKQLTVKQHQLLQIAEHSGVKLKHLIDEILNLRKLEVGKLVLEKEPTQLRAFFLRYCAQFDSLAESKKIDFSYHVQMAPTVVGNLDVEKCRQILYNLLSNAFKFTKNGGQIKVTTRLEASTIHLSVSDSGRGIHPDDLPQIFDRYFQTTRLEKPIEGGTGIGLAICKEYLQLFGGTITVDSTLGKGTTFKISFPVQLVAASVPVAASQTSGKDALIAHSDASAKQATKTSGKKQRKPHLLVVEDHPDLAKYLEILLSETYEITIAKHGQEAWDFLYSEERKEINKTYQLIISDLMMPVMDGYQLLEKLKTHDATRHIPVVMLTARAELQDKLKALRIGVDDYIIKPFEEEELLVRIDNLLQNQTNRQLTASVTSTAKQTIPRLSKEDQQWLVTFEQFVQKNLSNSILSVPMLADQFSMSEATLFRQVKRITGLSTAQYLKDVRLEKALRLLENRTFNSIAKVAYAVGYGDPNTFSRAFKGRFGKAPSKIIN
ncbi:MAG: ATP-binding protein [Bacteroidota bacterium]